MCGRSSCQTPAPMTVSGFGARDAGADQARSAAVGGLEHRVHLGLDGGRVFLQVDAERQQAAGRRSRLPARPAAPGSVSSIARDHRSAQRRTGTRSSAEPGQDAPSSAAKPSSSVASRRSAGSGSIAETTCADPATTSWSRPRQPERARSDSQERAAAQQVRWPAARRARCSRPWRWGRPVASATWAQQCVVDGAEQRGAGGGQGGEVVLARDPGRRLLGRLGDPGGERRPRDGLREPRQPGGLGGLRAEQARDQDLVEGVHGGQGLVKPGDGLGEQVGAHHAAVPGRREPVHLRQRRGRRGQLQVGQVAQEPAEDRRGGRGVPLRRARAGHRGRRCPARPAPHRGPRPAGSGRRAAAPYCSTASSIRAWM